MLNKKFKNNDDVASRFAFMKSFLITYVLILVLAAFLCVGQTFGMVFLDYNFFIPDVLSLPIIGWVLKVFIYVFFIILVFLIFAAM